jgi:hypothetical protein
MISNDLMAAAEEALKLALNDGEANGFKPGDWIAEDFDGHLAHARAHLGELQIRDGAFWTLAESEASEYDTPVSPDS